MAIIPKLDTAAIFPQEKAALWRAYKYNKTHRVRQIMAKLLDDLFAVCFMINIDCFMFFVTLVGSYHHHGMTPWDVDVDIVTSIYNKDVIHKALTTKKMKKYYALFERSPDIQVLYCLYPNQTLVQYCVLFFYKESSSNLMVYGKTFNKTDIFFTQLRPFSG